MRGVADFALGEGNWYGGAAQYRPGERPDPSVVIKSLVGAGFDTAADTVFLHPDTVVFYVRPSRRGLRSNNIYSALIDTGAATATVDKKPLNSVLGGLASLHATGAAAQSVARQPARLLSVADKYNLTWVALAVTLALGVMWLK